MHSHTMQWSRGLYLAGIVLALILAVPTAWFPFALAKVAVFAVCLFIAAVCFLAGGGAGEMMRAHGKYLALLVALLPLSYLLSTWVSVDRSMAWTGFALETDTVVFVTLLALAFFTSFLLFRTLRTVRLLLVTLTAALIVAALFQYASILWGGVPPLSTLADRSVNLIGKWNDLGLLMGLLLSCVLVQLEFTKASRWMRIALYIGAAILAVLLAFVNFTLAWGLVLGVCAVVGIAVFMTTRSEEGVTARTLPWASIIIGVVAGLLLFFGTTVNTGLTSVFPVSSLEVRPSFISTMTLASQAHGSSIERTLLGTGPDTFGEAWLLHKPAAVNQSDFWDLDFSTGYSTLSTAFLSVGALGALMWLIPLLLVLVSSLRVVRLRLIGREDRPAAMSLAVGSLFLLVSLLFYSPSPNIILLGFVLAGACFGYLWRQGRQAPATEHSAASYGLGLAGVVVLVLIAAALGGITVRRTVAEGLVGQGNVSLQGGDYAGASAAAEKSLSIEKTADALLLQLSAESAGLSAITASTTPDATIQQQFTATLQAAITAGQAEEALRPQDYRAYSTLGDVYNALVPLKINGAYQSALASYQAAATRNPTGPQIPLAEAKLEAANGNGTNVQTDLKAALTLKPNYTDAMLFLVQLAVSQNDLNTAVQAASAAVQSAPGVPSIWFELGLLYYSGNDTKDAIPPLKQAIALESDYANAQYFLGLSEYAQGDATDAIAQFESLDKSNPGNSDVTSVLSNMQAGQPAFGTSTPATTPTTAPVAQ